MNVPSRSVKILLLENKGPLSALAQSILQARPLLRLFHLTVVSTLAEAFKEIELFPPDVVLAEIDPSEDPDLAPLVRMHQAFPMLFVIALLPDRQQTFALQFLEKGAQDYLLQSQITDEALPSFLLRAVEKNAAQKAVRESEERFRMMIENASDVILILDTAGVISYASPSTERILGTSADLLSGRNALDFIHRDDRRNFLDAFEKAFEAKGSLPFVQYRFRRPDEAWIHMEGKGRVAASAGGGPAVCILNSHDVSHRVKMEEELRSLALRDELTSLHNRRSFVTVLEQQLKLAHRTKKKGIYLLFIDLDDFKWINDNLGHKEGDRALIDAAQILKKNFRDADIIARLGGDEFVVFLSEGFEDQHVDLLRKRLHDGVEEWNHGGERKYQLSMSVGVIHHDPSERRSTEELLFQADQLMYKQKREKKRLREAASTVLESAADTSQN